VEAMQTPFVVGPGGVQTLTLTLDQDMAPFFVNFVLLKPATADEGDFWMSQELVVYDFFFYSWLGIQYQKFLSTCGAYWEVGLKYFP
jgi:hypothetical protein